ncbi:hypothetical protein LSCM1_05183 [Leishmania martiniquensis]|uniref:Uncharacterized protein n=1 Tax=Leishmania martiniquensis TaxID=1580590 RepID=A0A836HHB6_9TRYP|nr:hypothetical protein LSCM1_05183 [Leishmania martiniquensis]
MNKSERKVLKRRIWLGIYIIFALAYFAGALNFGVEHRNYWACAGFSVVVLLIALRVALFLAPQYRLYQIFPPCSLNRVAYQMFFLSTCLTGISLGLWLMAKGIEHHQRWTGSSYFCGMIGMWMAAKWAYFVTVPIYELREDTLEEDALIKLGLIEVGGGRESGGHEPSVIKE